MTKFLRRGVLAAGLAAPFFPLLRNTTDGSIVIWKSTPGLRGMEPLRVHLNIGGKHGI